MGVRVRIKGSKWWDGEEYYYLDSYKEYRIGDILRIGGREVELLVIVELTYTRANDIVLIIKRSRTEGSNGYATEYAELTGKPSGWSHRTRGHTLRSSVPIVRHGSECHNCEYECKMKKKCWMYKKKAEVE